jgi:cytochrome c
LPTPAEIAGWDIDVKADRSGLPVAAASRTAVDLRREVRELPRHVGESNSYLQIAGGVGTLSSDAPIRTTGSKLKYATTLFDYIRRAMPFNAPQSLTADEVYSLTAYVLNLNDIVGADAVVDQDSLPKLKMPNRDGFTRHGLMRATASRIRPTSRAWRTAPEIRLSSRYRPTPSIGMGTSPTSGAAWAPSRRQTVAVDPGSGKPIAKEAAGLDLNQRYGCDSCHAVDTTPRGTCVSRRAARARQGRTTPTHGSQLPRRATLSR